MAIRIPIITTFDQRGVNKALGNLNNLSRQAGKAAGAIAGAAAVGIGASVNEFAKFDGALNQSLAIMGDVSATMRGEMSDAAREVAKTTTFSAEQAAESFFFLASAGLNAEQSVAALPQVAAFAQAGMFDMATATDLATDAQSALGLASDDAQENLDNLTRITDVFVKANTLANTSVEQLATALTTKAGTALANVGKDVEEGAAALAVFADQGIKGERAGTLLTNTIFGLTDRVEAVPEKFEALGISIFDSSGNLRNFADISDQFTKSLGTMTTEQKVATLSQLGFTKQSREGLLALLGQGDALREYEAELRKAGDTAQTVADKQLETFNGKLAILGSAVTDVALEIGAKMAPKIEELIAVVEELLPKIGDQLIGILNDIDFEQVFDGISKFINFVADNIHRVDELVVGLTALAVGLKGFTVAITIARTAAAAFGVTLAASLGPIGLVVGALSALAVVLGANALANQDTRTEQEKLNEKIVEAEAKLFKLRGEQNKNTNTSKLYSSAIQEQEERVRALKDEYVKTTGEVFVNTTEVARNIRALEGTEGPVKNLITNTEALRIEINKQNNTILVNNDLLISNATLQEAQFRHIQASRAGRHEYTGTLYDQIQAVMEENRLLLTTGSRYAETTDAIANQAGNLTYLTDQTTGQTRALDTLDATQLRTQAITGETAGAFDGLAASINQATEAQKQFSQATPGSPGPGGLFEVTLPGGGTALANLDGVQEGLRVAGTTGGGSMPQQTRKVGLGFQGAGTVEEMLARGFKQIDGSQLFETFIPLARGGIVRKPTMALVGEAGPEAVIPLDRAGKMGSKTTNVNITVNTGVGSDPVATGRAVVDAIKRYESVNGKVFQTA